MPWKKNSPEAVAHFDALAATPGATRGLLFGCPVYQLNGHRYASLYEERLVLRLAPEDRAQLLSEGGQVFAPIKGRSSKDQVIVPEAISGDPVALQPWVSRAIGYTSVS